MIFVTLFRQKIGKIQQKLLIKLLSLFTRFNCSNLSNNCLFGCKQIIAYLDWKLLQKLKYFSKYFNFYVKNINFYANISILSEKYQKYQKFFQIFQFLVFYKRNISCQKKERKDYWARRQRETKRE